MVVMPVSFTNNHNLLIQGFSVSSPLRIHMRFTQSQLKSPNNAEAHHVRRGTEKAQAPLNGASFLEMSSKEIQRDCSLLTLLHSRD